MLAGATCFSFTTGLLGAGVATALGDLANVTLVAPCSIAATASSSCSPSLAASIPNALLSVSFLGFTISKCGCETLFLTSFLGSLGFEAVSRADVLRPKMLKFDFCLELGARFGVGLADLVVVDDGVDLSSGSTYSMWRLVSAELASTDDGLTSYRLVGVSGR